MLNRVVLIGRLTRDPEMKYTPQGTAVATFSLAVNRKFNKEETDFIDVVAWKQAAEFVANYGTKGRLVAVEGRLQARTYETKEGQKRKVVEVVADDIKFLDKSTGDRPATTTAPADDRNYATDYRKPSGDKPATIDPWEELGKEINLEEVE